MPATERAFTETPPARLYLDTDIILNALIRTREHHERCAAFMRYLEPTVRTQFRLDEWQDSLVRVAYMRGMLSLFETFLKQFTWVEIPIGRSIRSQALQLMPQYALKAQDAAHLAAALQAGVLDIASFDECFRRIDGLYLWNDHVHSEQRAATTS